MRKLLNSVLKDTPALQAVVDRRIYAASSLGRGEVPAAPQLPFIVFREYIVNAENIAKDTAPNICRKLFRFYIHDAQGSYARIDQVISILRDTVRGLTSQVSISGERCIDVEWVSTSGDSEDPTYNTNLKTTDFVLVSTG